jgi:hypothetical protein
MTQAGQRQQPGADVLKPTSLPFRIPYRRLNQDLRVILCVLPTPRMDRTPGAGSDLGGIWETYGAIHEMPAAWLCCYPQPRCFFRRIRRETSSVPEVAGARLRENYGKLPLSFEENRGQADARVKFLSQGNGYTLLLSPGAVELNLARQAGQARRPPDELSRRARLPCRDR